MDSKDVEVSNLVPSTSANVHGVFVGALSPVKSSRNNTKMKYFEGQLSDGSKTVRFVSFEPKLRQQIEEAHEKCSSIALRNCAVKRNRQQDLEVLVSSQTKIHSSPKKFKIDDKVIKEFEEAKCSGIAALEELNDVAEHQSVAVSGKVVSMSPIEQINVKSNGKVLRKRDFLLADSTAVHRCVAWESDIELLQEKDSYRMTNATVRSFNGEKYLSIGQHCEIAKIKDIGEVVDDELPEGNPGRAKVITAEIVAVVTVDKYKSCRNCNTKIIDSDTPFAMCSVANVGQK